MVDLFFDHLKETTKKWYCLWRYDSGGIRKSDPKLVPQFLEKTAGT